MVEEFKDDWIQLIKDTGLNPNRISEGTKAASPAAGIGAGWATGNIWIGLATAAIGFLASGPFAKGYARIKFEAWKYKWGRIFLNCTEEQLITFDDTLKKSYPLVFSQVNSNLRMLE